jgi:hypothetical protein
MGRVVGVNWQPVVADETVQHVLADDPDPGCQHPSDDGGIDIRDEPFEGMRGIHLRDPRHADVVLTVAAGEAETGELERNPGHSPGLAALLSPRAQKIFLWTVLVLAVVGLLLLTLRLARRE